jgi:hypothetical protein
MRPVRNSAMTASTARTVSSPNAFRSGAGHWIAPRDRHDPQLAAIAPCRCCPAMSGTSGCESGLSWNAQIGRSAPADANRNGLETGAVRVAAVGHRLTSAAYFSSIAAYHGRQVPST